VEESTNRKCITMRVMCIERSEYMDNTGSEFTIEPGQWLEVYDNSADYHYYTFERNGSEWFIEINKFITAHQWRQNQLNKIGI